MGDLKSAGIGNARVEHHIRLVREQIYEC